MKSSPSDAMIRAAFADGFRATPEGKITNPKGGLVHMWPHHKTRYWYFSARGHRTPLSVHRFVAYQKFGDVALAAECVRHENDDRGDNRPDNILYGTKRQNMMDIPAEKRSSMGVKRNRGKRRYSDEQVREIRGLFASKVTLADVQRKYGGGFGSLANIRDGVTYRNVE